MAQTRGHVIAIANTKGGVGKSTLAGNLTWALATQTSRRVLLVDADPQASVTKWFDLATEDLPFDRTQLTTARVLHQQLPRLRQSYDLIVVDCPPMQSDVTAAAVTQADLGLVPVLPSPLDVLAYSELVPLLRQAQGVNATLALRFVINQSPRARHWRVRFKRPWPTLTFRCCRPTCTTASSIAVSWRRGHRCWVRPAQRAAKSWH